MGMMIQRPNILLIGDDAARMTRLRATLRKTARVSRAEDLPQALRRLAEDNFETVFSDWRFHCGTWREAVNSIGELYPDLPVIVVCDSDGLVRGSREWLDAMETGAFDLLLPNHREFEVLSLLEQAVASAHARALRAIA
jgi:DNA-binding NtrC family response regulator